MLPMLMQGSFEFVAVTRADGVSLVELNRPRKRNAMNGQLLRELTAALQQEEQAPEIGAVVLTGRGTVFSSGADLTSVAGLQGEKLARAFAPLAVQLANGVAGLMHQLLSMSKPVIAAVNGHAAGGGMMAALGCDFRVASRDALLWMPEAGMGRAIGEPSLQTLLSYVGPLVTKDIVLTSRRITAAEMATLNLVNRVAAAEEVVGSAMEWARALAALDRSTAATIKARANASLVRIWEGAASSVEDS